MPGIDQMILSLEQTRKTITSDPSLARRLRADLDYALLLLREESARRNPNSMQEIAEKKAEA